MDEMQPAPDTSWIRMETADGRQICPVCGNPETRAVPAWAMVVGGILVGAVAAVLVMAAVWACFVIGRAL